MKLHVNDQAITIVECEELVAGSVNIYTAEFSFDSSWDEYDKVAVFEGRGEEGETVSRETIIDGGKTLVPWETLLPYGHLRIGVYGVKGDLRLPTIYTTRQYVARGAERSEPSADPTPDVIDQVLAKTAEDRAAAEAAKEGAEAAQAKSEAAALRQPYPDKETGTWWVWDAEKGAYRDSGMAALGQTPQRGTDYWTAADQQAIVDDVLAALPVWEGGSY